MKAVISIIIPTYNRAQFLGETLNSVINQSYSGWECIVIDDGSIDYTLELMDFYTNNDSRMRYFQRPKERPKGANACRNFGFEKSRGKYILWFDSDDLMAPDHLLFKITGIKEAKVDFVVSQTANFSNKEFFEPFKCDEKPYGIKADDYILSRIHWFTYDVLLKREIAREINFNEKMHSWQDYNYFCKMLLLTENGKFIKKVLTYRRLHQHSIQGVLHQNQKVLFSELLRNKKLNYIDIEKYINKELKVKLIHDMMNLSFNICKNTNLSKDFLFVLKIIYKEFNFYSAAWFLISLKSSIFFRRGDFLLNQAKAKNLFQ